MILKILMTSLWDDYNELIKLHTKKIHKTLSKYLIDVLFDIVIEYYNVLEEQPRETRYQIQKAIDLEIEKRFQIQNVKEIIKILDKKVNEKTRNTIIEYYNVTNFTIELFKEFFV